MPNTPTFIVDPDNCDDAYHTVNVAGLATVVIKRENEGIIVDIFPRGSTEPAATTYAFDSDLIQIEQEDQPNQS